MLDEGSKSWCSNQAESSPDAGAPTNQESPYLRCIAAPDGRSGVALECSHGSRSPAREHSRNPRFQLIQTPGQGTMQFTFGIVTGRMGRLEMDEGNSVLSAVFGRFVHIVT